MPLRVPKMSSPIWNLRSIKRVPPWESKPLFQNDFPKLLNLLQLVLIPVKMPYSDTKNGCQIFS